MKKFKTLETTFDLNGNLIYKECYGDDNSNGNEEKFEYDSNGNLIHYTSSKGEDIYYKYDDNNNNCIYKSSKDSDEWNLYDSNGKIIFTKIYYNDSSIFEKSYKYDINGNVIYLKYVSKNNGLEKVECERFYEYDDNGNCICIDNLNGKKVNQNNSNNPKCRYEYDENGNCICITESEVYEPYIIFDDEN